MFKKNEVTSFDSILLNISGMRGAIEYEMISGDDRTEISLYQFRYVNKTEERQLYKRAFCDTTVFIGFLNDCGIMRWNGFNGKHPRGVLDGRMFRFCAKVNGGETIRASGSENFPGHFREFESRLNDMLRDAPETE